MSKLKKILMKAQPGFENIKKTMYKPEYVGHDKRMCKDLHKALHKPLRPGKKLIELQKPLSASDSKAMDNLLQTL